MIGRWIRVSVTWGRQEQGKSQRALTASLLLFLGVVLRGQKKLVEAEDCCRRCLALREELYTSQHADVAGALTGACCMKLTC
jgi:hypothetical protein